MIRSSLNFSCVGSTHEYYNINEARVEKQLHSLRINDIGDGGCKDDKFERDVRLLTDDLKTNPDNPRTHFYLASSYKNSGNYVKAIEHFKKRISLGGWIEENWYSRYELRNLLYENRKRSRCYSYLVRSIRLSSKTNGKFISNCKTLSN